VFKRFHAFNGRQLKLLIWTLFYLCNGIFQLETSQSQLLVVQAVFITEFGVSLLKGGSLCRGMLKEIIDIDFARGNLMLNSPWHQLLWRSPCESCADGCDPDNFFYLKLLTSHSKPIKCKHLKFHKLPTPVHLRLCLELPPFFLTKSTGFVFN